jgi:nicotinamidase-related amidase
MKTAFNEIVDVAAIGKPTNTKLVNNILAAANAEAIPAASTDIDTTLLILIDYQQDFMPAGALGVPGADADVARITRWMYDNLLKITQVAVSIDTHNPFQIFHPAWWEDQNGNNPPAFTAITLADLDSGKWRAVINPVASRTYVEKLTAGGKKVLVIWPYHCLQGTSGCALDNQVSNMVYFHSVARKSVATRLVKGTDPSTEMYGIIKPEYDPKNFVNLDFLNKIEKFNRVVIAGEAKSHCVLESIAQILEYYQGKSEVTKRIFILEDTMSNIPSFEAATQTAFDEFKTKYGVNLVTTQNFNL